MNFIKLTQTYIYLIIYNYNYDIKWNIRNWHELADDNYSDADSKIDVGGDTDDNSAHYIDDDVGVGSPDSDAAGHDVSAESGHGLKVKGYSDIHNHSHSANSGGSGGSKRKKKTRTVFSRSQVIQFNLNQFNFKVNFIQFIQSNLLNFIHTILY